METDMSWVSAVSVPSTPPVINATSRQHFFNTSPIPSSVSISDLAFQAASYPSTTATTSFSSSSIPSASSIQSNNGSGQWSYTLSTDYNQGQVLAAPELRSMQQSEQGNSLGTYHGGVLFQTIESHPSVALQRDPSFLGQFSPLPPSSSPLQHIDTAQYQSSMAEAVTRIKALSEPKFLEPPQQHQQQNQYSDYGSYAYSTHLALRRAQSMEPPMTHSSTPLLGTSVPASPSMPTAFTLSGTQHPEYPGLPDMMTFDPTAALTDPNSPHPFQNHSSTSAVPIPIYSMNLSASMTATSNRKRPASYASISSVSSSTFSSSSMSTDCTSASFSVASSSSPSPSPSPEMATSRKQGGGQYHTTLSALSSNTFTKNHLKGNNHSFTATSTTPNNSNGRVKPRYVCQIPNCHRTFSRPFNLKSHGLTHETQRPHACDQCPKTFARIHDRDRHMKGHLTEKAHRCIVCLGRFARQDAVTRHLRLAKEKNACALILKARGITFRDAAAGRVPRESLGDEDLIRRTLEHHEEQARKERATKNLQMGVTLGGPFYMQQHQQLQQQQQQQQHHYQYGHDSEGAFAP